MTSTVLVAACITLLGAVIAGFWMPNSLNADADERVRTEQGREGESPILVSVPDRTSLSHEGLDAVGGFGPALLESTVGLGGLFPGEVVIGGLAADSDRARSPSPLRDGGVWG